MTQQEEYDIVCHNIRYLRKIHGLSCTAMARKLHITVKTLDLLEAGISPDRIRISLFFHVWQAFGVKPTMLLTCRQNRDGD